MIGFRAEDTRERDTLSKDLSDISITTVVSWTTLTKHRPSATGPNLRRDSLGSCI